MSSRLAVLVVIAHPDDETLFAGFIHALTHKINAIVDLVCITNGEGGFRHSGPSEYLYDHLQLSNESIGRQHLPRIRKQELLASGKILGIRKFFFYDQLDLKYDRNVEIIFAEQWNKELVIQQLEQTIRTGNKTDGYDIMLIMLPSIESHGHHSASGLVALETIERLHQNQSIDIKIPTVIGGSEFTVNELPIYTSNRLAEISSILPNQFRFNRTWRLSNTTSIPDYRLIVIWTCSEHKTQGRLIAETLSLYARENEQYFYFSINNQQNEQIRIAFVENLFDQLLDIHQYPTGNVV
jgi:LmbE family N-acetylglucosaminyl deacetylase